MAAMRLWLRPGDWVEWGGTARLGSLSPAAFPAYSQAPFSSVLLLIMRGVCICPANPSCSAGGLGDIQAKSQPLPTKEPEFGQYILAAPL